jgi:hypothetical protein
VSLNVLSILKTLTLIQTAIHYTSQQHQQQSTIIEQQNNSTSMNHSYSNATSKNVSYCTAQWHFRHTNTLKQKASRAAATG